ncbi:hypothetical protein DPMN_104198 [Dreissena polymorpha]|uniref:Uncharacterized protein n=1 Tax=Dreissena polymorpha TaxID=45954 RepID=A0A9D4H7B5_DREPO|nr:hypothetical protein DPMN_104198 [Dreissena polymorpha]
MALRRHIELCACVTHRATQVCQVSSLFAHLHREIIAHSRSYYGVTGPIRASQRTFIDNFTGSDGTETPY